MKSDKIFVGAIIVSICWHLFWLSAVTIVSTPSKQAPVKFSKVSFLGPILERGPLEMRIEPRQRSILEKRYLTDVERIAAGAKALQAKDPDAAGEAVWDFSASSDEKLSGFIRDAVSDAKIEPVF